MEMEIKGGPEERSRGTDGERKSRRRRRSDCCCCEEKRLSACELCCVYQEQKVEPDRNVSYLTG